MTVKKNETQEKDTSESQQQENPGDKVDDQSPGDNETGKKTEQVDPDNDAGNDSKDDSGSSIDELPDWAKSEIKKLRSENAKSRTKNKGLEERLGKIETGLKSMFGESEDENLTPEQKLELATNQNQEMAFKTAMLELCLDEGITDSDDRDYLAFLVQRESANLEDDQELSEDKLNELIQKVKSKNSTKKASSSVDNDDDDEKNPDGDKPISVEDFSKMNILEKGQLYRENPSLYETLKKQAIAKGIFV